MSAGALPFGAGMLNLPEEPFRLDPVEAVGPAEPPARLTGGGLEAALDRVAVGLQSCSDLLLVVSDGSRRTGLDRYLPRLLERLEDPGKRTIRFIIASGLHRRPGLGDVAAILGDEVAGRYPVLLHDPDDPAGLVRLGETSRGTPVEVHRSLLEHDGILLTGAVGFHYHAGFSGGRKSLVPGLAGRATIQGNHRRTLRDDGSREPASRAGVLDGNPVHEDMLEAAAMVPAPTVLNTVLGSDGDLEGIWTGGLDEAHRRACAYLMRTRSIRLPPRPVVVVSAGGRPTDINLIQAHKAYESAWPALHPGGTLILAAECAEGVGDDEFLDGVRAGSESELAASLLAEYRVYGQTALAWRRKTGACRLILVSGLPEALVRETGAEPAASLLEAFRMAAERYAPGAPGWVFRSGAKWLVQPAG